VNKLQFNLNRKEQLKGITNSDKEISDDGKMIKFRMLTMKRSTMKQSSKRNKLVIKLFCILIILNKI